jgi:hypothetical protein
MIPMESSRAFIGADEKSSGFLKYPNRNHCRSDLVDDVRKRGYLARQTANGRKQNDSNVAEPSCDRPSFRRAIGSSSSLVP